MSGSTIAMLDGLTFAGCVLVPAALAVDVAERSVELWLAVDLALELAEDCWVRCGWLLVAAEIEVPAGAPAVGGACRGTCARNGIIA